MTEAWINAFLDAVIQAEQTEAQVTELSESAQRGLLAYCLGEPAPGQGQGAAGGAGFSLTCIRCGTPYQHQPPTADSGGSYLDYLFACGDCKDVLRGIVGVPSSPGRPAMSAVDARIQKYRHWRRHGIRSQASAPEAPAMPKPGAGRPGAGAPGMPVVGP